ncbi:MAG: glutaminyl-peptide cyclotransferase [Actinomycetota bacterium]
MLVAAAVLLAACSDDGQATTATSEPETPLSDPTTSMPSIVASGGEPVTTPDSSVATTISPTTIADAFETRPGEVVRLVPEVISTIPRSTEAFTQGLELDGDRVVETSGLYGASFVRLVDPTDWSELARTSLPEDVFAEGATVVGDRLIVLTWREEVAFVLDANDLGAVGELAYGGEGWGLCELDDGRLAMSNGSSQVTFRDPEDLSVLAAVDVTLDGNPIDRLNELECVGGDIWANVWQTEQVLRIDPATGVVEAVVDADGLLEPDPADADADDVLNGIAHLGADRFLITGKRWPAAFEVRFVAAG